MVQPCLSVHGPGPDLSWTHPYPLEGSRLNGSSSSSEMRKLPGEPNDGRSFALAPRSHLELEKKKKTLFCLQLFPVHPSSADCQCASGHTWHRAWQAVRRCPARVWVHIQFMN